MPIAATVRRVITDDAGWAADRLADGGTVAQAFANFYVITTRADEPIVRGVNRMKGRPPAQVGSITGPPSALPDVWDLDQLPDGLPKRTALSLLDVFFGLGPFGFRGPAAAGIPAHLTFPEGELSTAQVIAPGYACPSNEFLARALQVTGDDLLYITSANRSRHQTGADDSPAHFRAAGLRAEFGDQPGFVVVEHPDEDAARARYPQYLPMSTTILGLHTWCAGRATRDRTWCSTGTARCMRRSCERSWPSSGSGSSSDRRRRPDCCCATTRTASPIEVRHDVPDRAVGAEFQRDDGVRTTGAVPAPGTCRAGAVHLPLRPGPADQRHPGGAGGDERRRRTQRRRAGRRRL